MVAGQLPQELVYPKIHPLKMGKIRLSTDKIAERSSYEPRQTPQPLICTTVSNFCDVASYESVHSYFRLAINVFVHGVTKVTKHIAEYIVLMFTFGW